MTQLVAHGGVGGAIVETLIAVGIAAFFFAVWLRERRSRGDAVDDHEDPDSP